MSAIRAASAFVELSLRQSAFTKGLRSAERALARTGAKVRGVGQALLAAGSGIAGGLAIPVSIFASFDDQIRQVKAVTGATAEEFEKLTNTAKELGRTTSFTAGEVASLMIELGRAGFDPSQINRMTKSVLALSKATGTDATEASGIMAAAIRQFNLSGEDAARVADNFTVAANGSFNSVSSLGEALKFAGPVAADFGVSMEDTLAILGGLGNVGIQGSLAGSALRRLLTLTGSDAKRLQKIFGVSFVDAAGNARPLIEVLGEVNEATKDLGSAERAKKFKDAFGLLGISAASAIGKSVGAIGDLSNELNNSAGVAEKTASEIESGLGGSFRKLISAVEGIAISIGNALQGPLASFAGWVTEAAGVVTKFVNANQPLIQSVLLLAGGLIVAGGVLIATGVSMSILAFAIGGIVTAMGVLASVIGTATAVIASLGGVISFLASPIGLVLAGIGTLIGAFLTMTSAGQAVVDWFSSNFIKIFDTVSSTLGGIFNALTGGNLALAAEIGFTGLKLAVAQVMEEVESIFGISLKNIFANLAKLVQAIAGVFGKLNELRQKAVSAIADGLAAAGEATGVLPENTRAILKEDNERAQRKAEAFTKQLTDFDPGDVGKKVRESFDADELKKKLEALNKTAAAGDKPISKDADEAVKKIEGIDFGGFGSNSNLESSIKDGQDKIKSQGSFVGAAISQSGGSISSQMLMLQKQQLEQEKKREAKRIKRAKEQLEATKANKPPETTAVK